MGKRRRTEKFYADLFANIFETTGFKTWLDTFIYGEGKLAKKNA